MFTSYLYSEIKLITSAMLLRLILAGVPVLMSLSVCGDLDPVTHCMFSKPPASALLVLLVPMHAATGPDPTKGSSHAEISV